MLTGENEQKLFLEVFDLGHQCVTKLKDVENSPTVRIREFLLINIFLVVTDTSVMGEGQGSVNSVVCHGGVKLHCR